MGMKLLQEQLDMVQAQADAAKEQVKAGIENGGENAANEFSPNADEVLILMTGAAGKALEAVSKLLRDIFDKP